MPTDRVALANDATLRARKAVALRIITLLDERSLTYNQKAQAVRDLAQAHSYLWALMADRDEPIVLRELPGDGIVVD